MNKIILLIATLTLANSAYCQDNSVKKLDELFAFYQKENGFNGSVLIAKNGQILLNNGFGLQNAPLNKKNDSKGIFQIYSITKTFTACVILKLVEEGKLSLTDKLSKFYPNYPSGDSITIEHLLTHTSGMYDYTRGNNMPDQTEKSFVEFQKTKPLDFPSGTGWNYTNSGYYFLGYIIQKVTGLTYEKAVGEYIFKPLEMTQSGFAFKHLVDKNKAIGYEVFTENTKKEAVVYDPPAPFAAGGIYSTVEDLYKYYKGLKAYKILTKASLDKAYTPFRNNYGYGWVVLPMFDKMTVGHSGAGAGFRTNFVQIPEEEICIVLLSNTENDVNNITGDVLKILYNKPFKIPVSVAVPKEILKQYVGTYAVNDNFILYVSFENNRLITQPSKQPKSVLYPEKENLFYVTELNSYIRFEKNKANQVDTLIFNKEGQDVKAVKINPAWGVIGSATENGWDGADVKMTETETKGIWIIKNIPLKDGEVKFRFNSDWTVNLGLTEKKSNTLRQEGENIKVENGIYDIVLDLTDGDSPKYKISNPIFAQEGHAIRKETPTKYKATYEQLKEYEGLYEYLNNTTLKIAASPIDTILLCIINESRYPFTALGNDLFLDAAKDTVQFFRNKNKAVAGYITDKKTFKLLDKKLKLPREMWYPRLNMSKDSKYIYKQPTNDNDGLNVGNLDKSGLNRALLDELMQKLVNGTYKNVHSILIIKDGKLVFEEYFYEHNKAKLHEMRSATKSFISALTGMAIEKGFIKNKDEKVLPYFPEYTFKNMTDEKQRITIENLLTNQSGLDCDASNPKAVGNESIMSYEKDWIQYSLDLPMSDSAGGRGMYCSSNPIIMGRIIEKATKQTLPEFAKQTLFKDLGIKNFNWHFKLDPSSAETFGQVNLKSRDMAKFGLLYLNKGECNGKQVLSKEWVEQSFAKHTVVQGLDYGYLWWTKYLDADGVRYYGKLAQGNGGQKIYIFEEQNLVVVTTAGHYNTQSPINEIVAKYILPVFNKK